MAPVPAVRVRYDGVVLCSTDGEQELGVHVVHPAQGEAPLSTDSAEYGIQAE